VLAELQQGELGRSQEMLLPVVAAQACRAAADRDVSVCGKTGAAGWSGWADQTCLLISNRLLMNEALSRGDRKSAFPYCLESRMFLFGDHSKLCRMLFDTPESPRLCDKIAELTPASAPPADVRKAREICLETVGREPDCRTSQWARMGPTGRRICLGLVNVRTAALAGGRPELCGSNASCRAVFTGSEADCSPLQREVVDTYCHLGHRS
jgi:hypothetical protein